MSEVAVVSSCSKVGWEKYGKRFLKTFCQFWPMDKVMLHFVSEDDLNLDSKILTFHDLAKSPAWRKFRDKHAGTGWVRGDSADPRSKEIAPMWKRGNGYNFRFDSYKFCKKVFAIELVAKLCKGRLLWLDADTLTHAQVPIELAANLLPANYALSCLSRVGYHSECGFVGYNLDHQQTRKFIKDFSELYSTDKVFELAEWHDSWVFDWLRNKNMVATYNIPHKSRGHPFINSELGLYLDHLKGGRKDSGRSNPAERTAPPTEYWQGARRV